MVQFFTLNPNSDFRLYYNWLSESDLHYSAPTVVSAADWGDPYFLTKSLEYFKNVISTRTVHEKYSYLVLDSR